MARRLWWWVCVSVLMISAPAQAADKLARLVLAGPPAAVSFPLVRMLESGALADVAETVEFVLWRDPDQLRVLALNGKADVLAMPTNVAANLYNKGVPLQLLNVSTWGMLWLVSRDPAVRTLADLKGKEVAIPFRADMPDIVFSVLAEAQGIAPKRYFHLRYVASPLDAMQLLIMRRIDHALLAEPAVSMALRKTQSFPISVIAPELHRALDLQAEWGKTFKREARMPQAGIVAMGAVLKDPALAARVAEAYAEALAWCGDHAVECGAAVTRQVPQLMPEAVADSLAHSRLEAVSAQAARAELQFFFDRLMAKDPALIGGRLPDDGFYAPQ
jgi:NitT/TauT family transport system substrate-binding protein